MGLFWLAAAAAAKNSSKHSHRGHKESGGSSTFATDEVDSFSYLDCLFKELSRNNPELLAFFESISEEYKKIAEEEIVRLEDEAAKEFKESTEKQSFLLKLKEELAKESINVELRLNDDIHSIHKYEITPFYFNGYDIPFEYFLGKNFHISDSRKWNLDEFKSDKNNYEEKLSELRKKLSETQKKFYLLPSKRKQAKQIISEVQKDIDFYETEHDKISKKIEVYEKIDNLPSEIKELIVNCIDETKERLKLRKSALSKIDTISKLKQHNYYAKDLLILTMEKMTKEGKITKEILDKVFLQLTRVEIKARRGEYDLRSYGSDDYRAERLSGLLIWFINDVYEMDENFVSSNYNIVQEETQSSMHK